MGADLAKTLCALGLGTLFSNPVQRYGENLTRASIFPKKRRFQNRTELAKWKKFSKKHLFRIFSFSRR